MNRTRNQQRNQKPFVSGGVISNFTGTNQPASQNQQNQNIEVKMETPLILPPLGIQMQLAQAQPNVQSMQFAANPINQTPVQPMQQQPADEENGQFDATSEENLAKRRWNRKPVNKKNKRLRQNRRLRKLLTPKNALMSLNELMANTISEFKIVPEEKGFVAQVFVNNVQYEGRGLSKMAAKNNASEKALRDVIIQRMVQAPRSKAASSTPSGDSVELAAADLFTEDVEMASQEAGSIDDKEDESEVPMLHLASFALHKLFTEWQADGFEIPDFRTNSVAAVAAVLGNAELPQLPNPAPIKNEVPENAQSLHPSTLLCMMRPNTKYVDLGSEGKSPDITHRVGIEVDGRNFVGVAKSKKLARKIAARDACNTFFDTKYPLEAWELEAKPAPALQLAPAAATGVC